MLLFVLIVYFYVLLSSIPLYGYTIYCVFHLPVEIYLVHFQIMALGNKTAINIWVQIFAYILAFISLMTIKEWNSITDNQLYRVLPFILPLALYESYRCFRPSPTLSNVKSGYLLLTFLMKVLSHGYFNLHFSDTKWCWYFAIGYMLFSQNV